MKRILIAIAIFLLLVALGVFWYLFGSSILASLFSNNTTNEFVDTPILENNTRDLNREQQIKILDELAPENPVDTEEELEREIELLNQLSSEPSSAQTELDVLNALNQESSVQSDLDLLERLNNQ